MRRTGFLCGRFDPLTESERKAILSYLHTQSCREVFVAVKGEGILTLEERHSLLEKALSPYRKLKVVYMQEEETFLDITDEQEERKVRSGSFRKASRGIRKELLVKSYYLDQIVDACCKPGRAAHSRSVAQVCQTLAHQHGLDEKKAWQIGMLHDVTKKWDDERAQTVVQRYYPKMLAYSPKVWHSYTAPIFLYQEMGIRDHAIRHAIECHTIGNGRGAYDHIVYIADKCEPLRGYDVSVQMGIASRSLAEAASYVLNESKKYILEKEGIHV